MSCAHHHSIVILFYLAIIWQSQVKVYFSFLPSEIKVDIAFRSIIQAWMMLILFEAPHENKYSEAGKGVTQFTRCFLSQKHICR